MCLELMAYGLHSEKVSVDMREWDTSTKIDACSLLSWITDFEFLASFSVVHSLLGSLQGITQQLQGQGIEIRLTKWLATFNKIMIFCYTCNISFV